MYHIKLVSIDDEVRREYFASYEEAIKRFFRYSKKWNPEYRFVVLIGPDRKVVKLFRFHNGYSQTFSLYDDVAFEQHHYTIAALSSSLDKALIEDIDIHSHVNRFWVYLDNLIIVR